MKAEELCLDPRKWRLFLVNGRPRIPKGYTKETIWDHRLEEARLYFKYAKYDERFPPAKYPRMIMIGAGVGAELKAAKEYGYKPIGIGLLNLEQVTYARQQGVDFKIMDMHDLKFPNERFDIAYSMASFEHCVNPWLACIETWTVLRPYGRWWIWMGPYKGVTADSDGPGYQHFMTLPHWYIVPLFRRCGFKVLEYEDSNLRYWFLLEKMPLEEIRINKNVAGLLKRRLEIGREYSG